MMKAGKCPAVYPTETAVSLKKASPSLKEENRVSLFPEAKARVNTIKVKRRLSIDGIMRTFPTKGVSIGRYETAAWYSNLRFRDDSLEQEYAMSSQKHFSSRGTVFGAIGLPIFVGILLANGATLRSANEGVDFSYSIRPALIVALVTCALGVLSSALLLWRPELVMRPGFVALHMLLWAGFSVVQALAEESWAGLQFGALVLVLITDSTSQVFFFRWSVLHLWAACASFVLATAIFGSRTSLGVADCTALLLVAGYAPRQIFVAERTHRLKFLLKCQAKQSNDRASLNSQRAEALQRRYSCLKNDLARAEKLVESVMHEAEVFLGGYHISHEQLEFQCEVGLGSFGTVWKGLYNPASEEPVVVAIKTVRAKQIDVRVLNHFMSELKIMAPLNHRNLVNLIGGCWNEGPEKLCLVLGYCPGGTLHDLLTHEHFDVESWPRTFLPLISGVSACFVYLHLIHRDLKPANVLIDNEREAIVADFGESMRFDPTLGDGADDDMLMSIVGSPMYVAPEIITLSPSNTAVDVYSFGIVLLETLIGHWKLRAEFAGHHRFVASTGWRPSLTPEAKEAWPKVCKLVRHCLEHEPAERPDFVAISSMLERATPSEGATTHFDAPPQSDQQHH